MVQFAYVQNRVWRAPKALAGRVLPLLAAGRFRPNTQLPLEIQPVTSLPAGMMENQTARVARMISLAPLLSGKSCSV